MVLREVKFSELSIPENIKNYMEKDLKNKSKGIEKKTKNVLKEI